MSKALFAPGSKVELDGQNAVVSYENDEAFVLFFEGGRQREIPKQVLRLAFNEGRLKYRVDTPHSKLSRFPYLTRSEAKQAQRLLAYLSPMAESTTPGSVATHKAIIAEVVKTSGHEVLPAPKPITLYKWFKKWDASGRNVLALLPSVKGQQRQSRLAPQVVDLLNDAIDQFVLTNKPATAAKAYRSFEKKVQQLELDVKVPSAQTFYNYVNAVHPLERTLKQQGNAVFQEKSLAVTKHYQASYPMERVEFDGVHLTFGLVDEQLNLIAKEVIVFIAMDVYSRAIVGFSYKYGDRVSEDAELVINCVRSVLRQKNVTAGVILTH
ncbi:hypothetical protein [Marinobacter sp.]|uniref:hypothetical protein n=1 Tax=Marinobacter sp. TaxID=50741 RepID=UPI000C498C5C|nr:hypothetical protein [Marinobacter sp.]MBE94711.1 hypothetical protein [Marinobacter sp.]|tara:strand:+ start:1824 stop:2795 length:972 start_codon:yes stop_codon:yes gene_type:complete